LVGSEKCIRDRIEMDISEGSDIAYVGVKDNEESFGFLNDKKTDTPTYLDVIKNGSLIYNDTQGLSCLLYTS
ncbi:hypothetical protein DC362_24185, partial [Acinetobacter nosocomialis]